MATNLELDAHLIQEAMKWGKHKTKKAAVTAALKHYIRVRNERTPDVGIMKRGKKRRGAA